MFIRVIYAGNDQEEEKELLVNPNCGIRVTYDYIKSKLSIPEDEMIDLCDERGNLKSIFQITPWINALEVLPNRSVFYLVRFQTNDDGSTYPYPMIPTNHVNYEELASKLRRQSMAPRLSHKK